MFLQWKALAGVRSQALSCRMDAFQERIASRMLMSAWAQWRLKHIAQLTHRRQLLRSAVLRISLKATQRALFKWKLHTKLLQTHAQLVKTQQKHQENWDQRALRVAESHHSKRVAPRVLAKIFRSWRAFSSAQAKKLRILRKLTMQGASRLKFKGWTQWRAAVVLARQADVLKQEHTARLQGIQAKQGADQQVHSLAVQQAHAKELQELYEKLQEKENELLALQRREQVRDRELQKLQQQQLRDSEQSKKKQKQAWSESLESFFETAVKRVSLLFIHGSSGS